ncbi:hypothetical protein ACFYNO_32740 [Kitasatospora sp. NPDC006697]|uniref:hypothetical protein n=1 Tax=Kitasatospora sp. NPDC006697 TaxID=3364020 RepID=UPI0036C197BF
MLTGQEPAVLAAVLIFFSAVAASVYAIKKLSITTPATIVLVIGAIGALLGALPPVITALTGSTAAPAVASTPTTATATPQPGLPPEGRPQP